jgi:hypothetical protein
MSHFFGYVGEGRIAPFVGSGRSRIPPTAITTPHQYQNCDRSDSQAKVTGSKKKRVNPLVNPEAWEQTQRSINFAPPV